jgi:hypothetical protein
MSRRQISFKGDFNIYTNHRQMQDIARGVTKKGKDYE